MKRKGLAVGIILLFVGAAIIPAIAQDIEKPSQSTSRGNWLYVGGSGPGNYSRIQDAINASSDGDTVFVYDDSSPYYEHLTINYTITLKGENKNTTIIDGNRTGNLIKNNANEVIITGFTIQNATIGIFSTTNRNQIFGNNILNNNQHGIYFHANHVDEIAATRNRIENNYISKNRLNGIEICVYEGYVFGSGSFNSIRDNILTENGCGIYIGVFCSGNLIYGNIIMSNQEEGINLDIFIHGLNRVVRNHIEQNGVGIRLYGPSFNIIRNNNIIQNSIDAIFLTFITRLYNLWIGNYWGRPYLAPKVIIGFREIPMFQPWADSIILPCIAFDIRPALKPYAIGVR